MAELQDWQRSSSTSTAMYLHFYKQVCSIFMSSITGLRFTQLPAPISPTGSRCRPFDHQTSTTAPPLCRQFPVMLPRTERVNGLLKGGRAHRPWRFMLSIRGIFFSVSHWCNHPKKHINIERALRREIMAGCLRCYWVELHQAWMTDVPYIQKREGTRLWCE